MSSVLSIETSDLNLTVGTNRVPARVRSETEDLEEFPVRGHLCPQPT
ncbi:MAG: hypothetical protein ACNA8K_00930 [Cyclonatronaceae bacterium]